jgi:hypothetical protein
LAINSSGKVKAMTALVDSPIAAPAEAAPATPTRWPRLALAGLLAATALLYLWNLSATGYGNTSLVLLHRAHFGPEWLHWVMTAVAVVAALGVLVAGAAGWDRVVTAAVAAGIVAGAAGTTAFAIATAATPHNGGVPAAVHTADASKMDGPGMRGPGMGGPGPENAQGNAALAALLAATNTKWSAATSGSPAASGLEIASGTSVMAIGGFSGDPVPTLQQFIDYIHAGQITYYVGGGHDERGGPPGQHGNSNAQQIADWVAHNYAATTVGGTTVYRLT